MSFDDTSRISIELAKEAALQILLHNAKGPCQGLPRTAGWGYPEPYTRDLMISALGFLATGNEQLEGALERTLIALANNQTVHGHIPSLAHDPANRGSSDSTPLFLFGLALYRTSRNQPEFLLEASEKARKWMQYQSPDDRVMVAQLPTSDWRDEQYVMGYGLYVNMIVYAFLRLYGEHESAEQLRGLMSRLEVSGKLKNSYEQEALVEPTAPYYALYSYKVMSSGHKTWCNGLKLSARPCGAAENLRWSCRPVCSRIFCPTMRTGCHVTSAITGLVTIITGVCGHSSAGSI
jgi:hypothetical protein